MMTRFKIMDMVCTKNIDGISKMVVFKRMYFTCRSLKNMIKECLINALLYLFWSDFVLLSKMIYMILKN